mgnify:CR=1 FL=1
MKTNLKKNRHKFKILFGEWIMAGEIFIHKVMTDEEVRNVLIENGYIPMPRKDGDIDLSKYGF